MLPNPAIFICHDSILPLKFDEFIDPSIAVAAMGLTPEYFETVKHMTKNSYITDFTNGNIALGDSCIKLPKFRKV